MGKNEDGATAKGDVSKAAVEEFANKVLNDRLADVQSMPAEVQPSAALVAQIEKRVPPSSLGGYTSLSGATKLLAIEIDSIGSRINRYRYLAQYGNHFKSPSPEIGIAFMAHLHDLRPAELYIILERGTEALRFASIIAAELGYKAGNRSVAFSKAFKKRLERRLRERHRVTHAHERSSLITRILELPAPKTEEDRSNMAETLGDLLGKVTEALALAHEEAIDDAYKRVIDGEFRKVHLDQFEAEASFMWELFTQHMAATFA